MLLHGTLLRKNVRRRKKPNNQTEKWANNNMRCHPKHNIREKKGRSFARPDQHKWTYKYALPPEYCLFEKKRAFVRATRRKTHGLGIIQNQSYWKKKNENGIIPTIFLLRWVIEHPSFRKCYVLQEAACIEARLIVSLCRGSAQISCRNARPRRTKQTAYKHPRHRAPPNPSYT